MLDVGHNHLYDSVKLLIQLHCPEDTVNIHCMVTDLLSACCKLADNIFNN